MFLIRLDNYSIVLQVHDGKIANGLQVIGVTNKCMCKTIVLPQYYKPYIRFLNSDLKIVGIDGTPYLEHVFQQILLT